MLSVLSAVICLAYLVNLRVVRQVERSFGLLIDDYSSLTLGQTVKKVSTWSEAELYLMSHLKFDWGQASFDSDIVHTTGRTVCFGGAKVAQELLSDNTDRYETDLYLFRGYSGRWVHMIALVKDKATGRYGSLGINASDCIAPVYKDPVWVLRKTQLSFFWKKGGFEKIANF